MTTTDSIPPWQRAKLCEVLQLGCDRATACDYVGVSPAQLHAELLRDETFSREVLRAEAQVVLRHFSNVQRASQDEKNWRTSVWWLEQRAALAGRGGLDAGLAADASELVGRLARAVVAEVTDVTLQRRIIERLNRILAGEEEAREPLVLEARIVPGSTRVVDDADADAEEGRA